MIGNVKIKNRLMMAPMDTGFGNNAWGGFTPEGVEYFARRAEGGFGLLFSGGTSADCKVDKKTFYHYYETLDFLLAEMQAELSAGFLERVKDYALPDDLDKVSRAFFLYAAEQGLAYKKITCGGSYHAVRDEMTDKVTDAAWSKSKKYHQLNDY